MDLIGDLHLLWILRKNEVHTEYSIEVLKLKFGVQFSSSHTKHIKPNGNEFKPVSGTKNIPDIVSDLHFSVVSDCLWHTKIWCKMKIKKITPKAAPILCEKTYLRIYPAFLCKI